MLAERRWRIDRWMAGCGDGTHAQDLGSKPVDPRVPTNHRRSADPGRTTPRRCNDHGRANITTTVDGQIPLTSASPHRTSPTLGSALTRSGNSNAAPRLTSPLKARPIPPSQPICSPLADVVRGSINQQLLDSSPEPPVLVLVDPASISSKSSRVGASNSWGGTATIQPAKTLRLIGLTAN